MRNLMQDEMQNEKEEDPVSIFANLESNAQWEITMDRTKFEAGIHPPHQNLSRKENILGEKMWILS